VLKHIQIQVPPQILPSRVDKYIAGQSSDFSRSFIQKLIERSGLRVNGRVVKSSFMIRGNETLELDIPTPSPSSLSPEKIDLNIVFEDKDIIVINKSAGIVVHPGPGHRSGTLVHALLYHSRFLSSIQGCERPGIVHRLDKDTSGLIVVAKNDLAHHGLAEQIKKKKFQKIYQALCWKIPLENRGTINKPIGRHRTHRQAMTVDLLHGREAITHYRVRRNFGYASWLEIRIETGRTHQIRVHLSSIGVPIIGDSVYGQVPTTFQKAGLKTHWPQFQKMATRQMLHAQSIGFIHPALNKRLKFSVPLPQDMQELISLLEEE